jgi:hypothetical protein
MKSSTDYKERDTGQYISTPMGRRVNYAQTSQAEAFRVSCLFFLSPLRSFVFSPFFLAPSTFTCTLLADNLYFSLNSDTYARESITLYNNNRFVRAKFTVFLQQNSIIVWKNDFANLTNDSDSLTNDFDNLTNDSDSLTNGFDSRTNDSGSRTNDFDSRTNDSGSLTNDFDSRTNDSGSLTNDFDSRTNDSGSLTNDFDSRTND